MSQRTDEVYATCRRAAALARLRAEAPALLQALKRLREVFDQLSEGDSPELDATSVAQPIESDGLRGCDIAISKAEGRSDEATKQLLAALREVADGCEYRLRKGRDSGDEATLRLCRAAIHKAEGRS